METKTAISLLLTFVVLCIIGTIIYFRLKNSPKQEDKEAAKKFLEGLKDNLYNLMLNIIRDFDYSQYESFVDMEANIMFRINECCHLYIEKELEKQTDLLSVLALKALKSGMIDEFIEFIISTFNVDETIKSHANKIQQDTLDESVKEDNKLQEKFSNEEEYYSNEESTNEDLEKVNEEELKKEEESHKDEIIPMIDDEEPYNPEDPSMEVLEDGDDGKENNNNEDIYYDSTGRARSKSTGRYVKLKENE